MGRSRSDLCLDKPEPDPVVLSDEWSFCNIMRILAISGSLRAASSNTALLEAARILAPEGVEIDVYEALGALPHFNPDLDGDVLPAIVVDLRARIGHSSGVLISSPEYAHGVPGVLKNALDWLVGSVEFPGKPVALINTSPRATYAQAALTEILTTMSARLIAQASVTVPLLGKSLDRTSLAEDAGVVSVLRCALSAFVRGIEAGRG